MPTAKRILIADHGTRIRGMVGSLFEADGYEIIFAGDYSSALDAVADKAPRLVLVEVALPGKNGYKLCEHIKNEPSMLETAVILFSGAGEKLNKEEALWVGADEYVTSIADANEILEKSTKLLSRQKDEPAEKTEKTAVQPKSKTEGMAVGGETLLSEMTFPEEDAEEAPKQAPKPKAAATMTVMPAAPARQAPQLATAKKPELKTVEPIMPIINDAKVIEPAELISTEKLEMVEPADITPMAEPAEAKHAPAIKAVTPPTPQVTMPPPPQKPKPQAETKEARPSPMPFAVTAVPADKLQEFIEITVARVVSEVAEDAVAKAVERIVRSEACKAVDAVVSETVSKAVDAVAAQTVSKLAYEAVLSESGKVIEGLAEETVLRVADKIIKGEVKKFLKEALTKED